MWQPLDQGDNTLNNDIEQEIETLTFLIHNQAKIMYALRHNHKKLYTFDVNQYVDIIEILKKKKFYLLEEDPNAKEMAFCILDILNLNKNI